MKKVIEKNGRLMLEIDGKEVPPIAYMSYLPEKADYDKFAEIGYELFSVCINMGDRPINYTSGIRPFYDGIWKSRDVYDFTPLDDAMNASIGKEAKGYVLLRVNANVPEWWEKENPDEMTMLEDGRIMMQSVFSEKWIKDVKTFFDKLKEYIDASEYRDNVVAWQIAAMNTQEWIAPTTSNNDVVSLQFATDRSKIKISAAKPDNEPDFSVCAKSAFSAWCEKKYVTTERLNSAWKTKYRRFSEIVIPSGEKRNIINKSDVSDVADNAETTDYYHCFNEAFATAIKRLTGYVKEIYDNDILVGAFYGYIGELTCRDGHCEIDALLDCKSIDFFASPFSYVESRKTPVDWFYHSGMQSCAAAGKLWFLEADVRTDRTRILHEVAPSLIDAGNKYMDAPVWYGPDTEEESVWNIVRAFSKILISGNAFWWFDMWGGWYGSPRVMELMRKMREEYVAQQESEFKSGSEVAVILDSQASYGISRMYFDRTVFDQLAKLGSTGAPYDLYFKSTATQAQLSAYKIIIYLVPLEICEKDRKLIRDLAADGKCVLLTGKEYGVIGNNVYNETDAVSVLTLRDYYRTAGVHLYTEAHNVVYANDMYLCVTASENGEKVISLKQDCALQSFLTGEIYRTENGKFTVMLKRNQSELFKYLQGK